MRVWVDVKMVWRGSCWHYMGLRSEVGWRKAVCGGEGFKRGYARDCWGMWKMKACGGKWGVDRRGAGGEDWRSYGDE